jgi:calcineurin-like phosphoesterase family protein
MDIMEPQFDFFISDTHINHVKLWSIYEAATRLAWGDTLDAHNDTIIDAWNRRIQPGQRVLHLGDWAMGQRHLWPGFRARLNGDITLLLGNHDITKNVTDADGFTVLESFTWQDPILGRVVARHDPAHFTDEEVNTANVLLHGHLHTGKHRHALDAFGRKAHCLSIEVLPHSPEPLSYLELVGLVQMRGA